MTSLRDFMETVNFRITEGSDYGWQCFGPNAYRLDSWNGDQDGHTVTIVFDTGTQTVYQLEAFDYARSRAYRWTNPDFRAAHEQESSEHGEWAGMAWDDVKFVELELAEDLLDKARAILSGQDYDTRVQVPIDLPDQELFQIMKMAHDRDITLNKMVEEILTLAVEQHRADS